MQETHETQETQKPPACAPGTISQCRTRLIPVPARGFWLRGQLHMAATGDTMG